MGGVRRKSRRRIGGIRGRAGGVSFIKSKKVFEIGGDFFSHSFFVYRLFFLGKMNFRGRKLAAFNFIIKLKFFLKMREEGYDPSFIFTIAFINLTPLFFVRNIWMGNVSKSLPFPLFEEKKFSFAVMYFFRFIKQKYGVIKIEDLVELLISSLYKRGPVYEQKIELYKKSMENRHLLGFLK